MDKKLFDDDDSDNEVTFKANSEYAKKYNTLRRKEEWLKLKNKYGESAVLSEESSSSDDEEDVTLTEEFERDFFKTLACLKKKDPRIYDKNVRFFENDAVKEDAKPSKKNDKPMTIRDYNRKIIVENEGVLSDTEEDNQNENTERPVSPSYTQEQQQIRKEFSSVINDGEEDPEAIGGLFSKKKKTKQDEEEEEKGYRDWIAGQVNHLQNNSDENDLKPLKDFWSNPLLEKDEAFLRDYFLNQRFKEDTDTNRIPSYDEIVNDSEDHLSEDEKILGEQTEFEHKFNFRFEEPDQDFIKRYPRTLEHSIRRKDDRRAKKRAEVKDRKIDEKKKKKEEIAQLKALKLKEIKEKIEKLKEITGNEQLAFNDEDIEGDFDPDAHDRRMRELFDGEYYNEEVDKKKPQFPELDEELEIDNWEAWNPEEPSAQNQDATELHCEDDNFNMDCEFDPKAGPETSLLDELKDATDGRRKRRKRKNKLAEALARKKPVFDPQTAKQTYSQYLEEYYKLDCEDVIGDMPCRFKYREVPPLDYGLTTAEIFMADDDELNRWYPLKKTLQYRQEHKQRNDQKILEAKARNVQLKRKILPSLFKQPNEEDDPSANNNEETTAPKKKKNRKKKSKDKNRSVDEIKPNADNTDTVLKKQKDSKDVNNSKIESTDDVNIQISENNVNSNGVEKKSEKKKRKRNNNKLKGESNSEENSQVVSINTSEMIVTSNEIKTKRKRNKNKIKVESIHSQIDCTKIITPEPNVNSSEINLKTEKKKRKRNKNVKDEVNHNVESNLSNGVEESIVNKKRKCPVDNVPVDEDGSPKKKKKKMDYIQTSTKIHKESDTTGNSSKKKKNKLEHNSSILNNHKSDPMSQLSDERLKAFGLNPKKYRSFMKFKKY